MRTPRLSVLRLEWIGGGVHFLGQLLGRLLIGGTQPGQRQGDFAAVLAAQLDLVVRQPQELGLDFELAGGVRPGSQAAGGRGRRRG